MNEEDFKHLTISVVGTYFAVIQYFQTKIMEIEFNGVDNFLKEVGNRKGNQAISLDEFFHDNGIGSVLDEMSLEETDGEKLNEYLDNLKLPIYYTALIDYIYKLCGIEVIRDDSRKTFIDIESCESLGFIEYS